MSTRAFIKEAENCSDQEAARRLTSTGLFENNGDGTVVFSPLGRVWVHLLAAYGDEIADELCKEAGLLPPDC